MKTIVQEKCCKTKNYIIVDNDGNKHFMNDRLAAQLLEERWKKEKEKENKN